MYDFFSGKLVSKNPAEAVLETGGIGYHFVISLATFALLPESGQSFRLFAYLQVREDAHQLFGFATEAERETFRLLISVSGIGPKLAMTTLSGMGHEKLKEAIAGSDLV